MTVVQTSQNGTEALPLRDLMSNVSFDEGQRYADYMKGDDVAKVGLTELVANDGKSNSTANLLASAGFLAGAIFAVILAAAVAALLIVRKVKRQKTHSSSLPANGSVNGKTMGAKGGAAGALLKMALARNGSNARNGRKREFNYNKYYADLMMQVSSGSHGIIPFLNGTNGHSLRSKLHPQHAPQPESPAPQPAARTNAELVADLIANQKSLIEEQKRLLQQQTRLIDEKSKMLEEKSKMLEQQSDLIESNML